MITQTYNRAHTLTSILWNAVTSPGTFLNGYLVKTMLYKPPSLILYLLDCYMWRPLSFTELPIESAAVENRNFNFLEV